MGNLFRKIASYIYGTGVRLRNFLYDTGVLKSRTYDIPIICVGNITVGGTGKTPVAEMIVDHMASAGYNVALLSRGYGRRTKGYLEVGAGDSYRDTGDEPLQIKRKYPSTTVVVCEDRAAGIERLRAEHPDVDLIVMDDGFQHRSVTPSISVVIIDSTRPVEQDHMLPYGTLRDNVSSLSRANYFIVSKCRDDMSPLERRLHHKVLVKAAYQKVYFTRYEPMMPQPVFPLQNRRPAPRSHVDEVIAMAGIGNPSVFVESLMRRFKVVGELCFDDHHVYRIRDLRTLSSLLAEHPAARIVTTEKDAVKIFNSTRIPDALKERLYYIPVKINYTEESDKDFLENLEKDVRKN